MEGDPQLQAQLYQNTSFPLNHLEIRKECNSVTFSTPEFLSVRDCCIQILYLHGTKRHSVCCRLIAGKSVRLADGMASQQLCKWKTVCCWRSERDGKLATKGKESETANRNCNGKINSPLRFTERKSIFFRILPFVVLILPTRSEVRKQQVGKSCLMLKKHSHLSSRGRGTQTTVGP